MWMDTFASCTSPYGPRLELGKILNDTISSVCKSCVNLHTGPVFISDETKPPNMVT